MEVQEMDWETWRNERGGAEEFRGDDVPDLAVLAKQDMGEFRKCVLYAPKRCVPQGACPLELFRVLLFPKWR
eukprot:707879-Pyramimonas_sp.AAC.1